MRRQWRSVLAGLTMAAVGCGGRVITYEDGEGGSGGASEEGGAATMPPPGGGKPNVGAAGSGTAIGGQPAKGGSSSRVTPSSGGRTGTGGRAAGGTRATGAGGAPIVGVGGSVVGKGGAAAAGAGGATTLPDSSTFTMTPFAIEPGGEVYYCQNFANPFHASVDIGAFESHMSPGSHHLLLNGQDGTADGPLSACSGLTAPTGPYVSQQPDGTLNYPDGVASPLVAGAGYMLQVHYLNTSVQQTTPKVLVTLHRAKGTVSAHARLSSSINLSINVAPNATGTSVGSFSTGSDVHLFQLAGHMHRHGVHFQALLGNEALIDVDGWETPPKTFSPPRVLTASQHIDFTCTYKNDTSTTLTFGESAATNEMCILLGQYY